MRDPRRIRPLLQMLGDLWERMPDMRLGQLLYFLQNAEDDDPYYTEDDAIEHRLRNELRNKNGTPGRR